MDTNRRAPGQAIALVIMLFVCALVVGLVGMLAPAVGIYFTVFAPLYALPAWFGPTSFAFRLLLPLGSIIGLRVVRSHLQRHWP